MARFEGDDGGVGFGALGFDLDAAAGAGGQHHQAHDGAGIDGLAVLGDADLGVIARRGLDELGRGAGVQAAFVDDLDGAGRRLAHRSYFSPART